MTKHRVRLGMQLFTSDDRQPLIEAIPDSEIVKGCLKGVCRVCRCKLLSGKVSENEREILSPSEFLPCVSRAESDIEISPAISAFQTAKIKSRTYLSDNILEIVLDVKRVFYNSKSIVTLKHPNTSVVRSYSVVSLGIRAYDSITFHVKLRPGGLFSDLFKTISIGAKIEFILVNPTIPEYLVSFINLNVISGGSGMGAALTRAKDIVAKYSVRNVNIYAINRNEISNYHLICIDAFSRSIDCTVDVCNINFIDWTDEQFDVSKCLAPSSLTIGVGSDTIISKLRNFPSCELESFG